MVGQMKTISEHVCSYVEHIGFADLPEQAVHKTKQFILDTFGCVLCGFSSPSASITRDFSLKSFTQKESTIVGGANKSSCFGAALANGTALRQSEFMDYLAIPFPSSISVTHPSETIPPIWAVSERENSSGKDFLLSVFLGYELSGRFCAFAGSSNLSAKGWHHATLGYSIIPLVVGKLLGLSWEQLSDALGISACQATLGIIDAEGEEYDMVKNLAFPLSAQVGMLAAMLAKNGFTGSRRVIEGEKGFLKSIVREEVNPDALLELGEKPWVLETRLKPYPVCGAAQGLTDAAVNLARNHNIQPEEVKSILVHAGRRTVGHVGDAAKKYPKNKETADHSAPYIIAVAILTGDVKPEHFREDMYSNRRVLQLIDKVKVEISPEFDDPKVYPAASVEVRMLDGSVYAHKTVHHRGHPENPMQENEIEDKFLQASSSKLGEDRAKELIRAVYRLEKMGSMLELMELARAQV